MKSRKPAKASSQSRRADQYRKQMRSSLRTFETLEDRRLMTVEPWSDGLYYPIMGALAGIPAGVTPAQYKAISQQQFGGSSRGSNALAHGEGTQPFINSTEAEPNDSFSQAQYINLGTGSSQSDGAAIVGNLSVPVIPGTGQRFDEDWFAFDLRAGDVFDAAVVGLPAATFDLSILDASRNEVAGTSFSASAIDFYPLTSPLRITTGATNADLAFVAPTSGRYYARISDGDTPYTLTLRVRRPALESEPVGTKQKIFLDFDGALVRREIFDPAIPGTARLSPLSNFLAGWGFAANEENMIIDRVIDIFRSKLVGPNAVAFTGGNGWYSVTGTAGQFDFELLNSRDNPDPWGQPNVTRIIIGGSVSELLIPTIGIAQSIDVGNFDTEETTVVLLDNMDSNFGSFLPRAASKSYGDVIIDAIASVAVHEFGHLSGMWHTLNNNNTPQIMDTGGAPANLLGVGPDGIYGTADDISVQFGTDTYDIGSSAVPFGRQNSAAAMAFGLSTGTVGGATIRGNVFQDNNFNRVRDAGDLPIAAVAIYADANNNGLLDTNEQRTFSDANGNYQLTVAPGYYVLREYLPTGFTQVAPAGGAHGVSVTAGQVVTGKDFANERANAAVTGIKWNDVNGNGVRDNGEAAIPGVYVYVDLDGDNRLDIGEPAAVTNADGAFKLNFPGVGVFTVREVEVSGFTQTYPGPAYNNEHTIFLTGNPVVDAPRVSALHFGNLTTIDFGDAPSVYGTASSGFRAGLTLGTLWDAEASAQFSNDALGDDNNGVDDEDAINTGGAIPRLRVGSDNQISITATNNTGQTAYLQAWIDSNGINGFEASEQVAINVPVTGTGTFTATLPVLATARLGNTFARLRLSSTQNVGPTGQTADGEVEDYLVTIVPDQLAVNDNDVTVSRNSVLNPIDVLANDFRSPGETLEVINVSNPSAQGGLVTFTASGVSYTPRAGYIGPDSFTYLMRNSAGETDTATVNIDVRLFFENPQAIDDSFEVPTDAIDFPLNVLANDIEGQNGALSIVSITPPDKGGALSIATGNKSLRYTPDRTFGGTEFFTYTVADAAGRTSTATGTIHTLPGDRANDTVQIRLVATNTAGAPISRIQQNQDFKIDVYVDDLRFDTATPSPDLAAGVFAAYFDLLYNLQLVSTALPTSTTPSGFNFDVSFFNNYLNGARGDATIPGIIDELGAFFDGSNMNRPNELRLASITFKAKTPGIATFLADPADVSPSSNTLLFDSSSTPVPTDQIRYLGTSVEIVGDGVVFPVAVDDSPSSPVPVGASRFPINVLANDLAGSSGPITVKPNGFSNPLRGQVELVNNQVVYTPSLGFTGSDQFTYTIVDTQGNESIGRVTVKVGNNSGADDEVRLPLRVTDLNGATITQVTVGQQFQLRGTVQDTRNTGTGLGIFSAYQDVIYSAGLVSPVTSGTNSLGFQVTFGPQYQRVREGDVLTRGIINEIGAVATSDSEVGYGSSELLLFTVTLTAQAPGVATFVGDPADISPLHDTLTFQPVAPVAFDKITYGLASVTIVNGSTTVASGEFTNSANPLDVNADGYVSPIDALAIINALNTGGSRSLLDGVGGEGEASSRFFIDTNGDDLLTPMDVLNVINYLNANSSGRGLGEGEGESSASELSIAANNAVYSDELFDDGIDELIDQLAPEIEQTWKKKA